MKKRSYSKRLKKLEKKVNSNKPETKQFETSIGGPLPNIIQQQFNTLLCDPDKGTNSNQRIGDSIKAISYYGVFYFNLTSTTPETTQGIRFIHYLSQKPNEGIMENNGGTALAYNQIPADKGYIIQEDKLITLSKQGPALKKLIVKGKFKYPINLKWETNNNKIDWHPRLYMTSTTEETTNANKPQVQGQMRYYYTDA